MIVSTLSGMGAAAHALTIAEALRLRGHRVSVVTSASGVEQYRRRGFETHVVPERPMPELHRNLPPLVRRARQLFERVQHNIIEPLQQQWAVVGRVIREAEVDVVVTDALLLGASMLASTPRGTRPAVIMVGFFAPWAPDPSVPPYGMGMAPSDSGSDRVRAAAFELIAARAYALLSRSFNREVEQTFGTRSRADLRTSPEHADVWAQLTVPRFEYPRTALPRNFRFVGPLHPPSSEPVPAWWDPAEEPPVIAIRAESAAAVRDLVVPAIRAFGATGNTLIVAGVTRAETAAELDGPLPANVHFEDRLPWSRLISNRTVVISDGDYLHTQHALRQGIPLVLAGTLETDVETAARVAWCGAGIDLRTGSPTPEAIRQAVELIRSTSSYRLAAAGIAAQIAATDAESSICDLVEEVVGAGRSPSR